MSLKTTLGLFFALTLLTLGCSAPTETKKQPVPPSGLAGVGQPAKNVSAPGLPSGHPPINGASNPTLPSKPKTTLSHGNPSPKPRLSDQKIKGTVLEVHNAASYTYIKVKDQTSKEQWAAVLQIPVKQGQKVEINQQMVMDNFQSKSLNRTFEKIIFGTAKVLP
jgi:hypothetical protein